MHLSKSNDTKKAAIFWYLELAVLMIALGSSDAARGVFATVFQNHFSLDTAGISMIVTISYIGNLVFMLIGSRLSDAFGLYVVFPISILMMGIAYCVCTVSDSYPVLLVSIFFTMGASTLLNTLMNVMSPDKFRSPGMIINTLFFVQGIGTTVTQSIVGGSVSSFRHWHLFCLVILLILVFSLLFFVVLDRTTQRNLPDSSSSAPVPGASASHGSYPQQNNVSDQPTSPKDNTYAAGGYLSILQSRAFWMLLFIFGFYFVAEHGIMNWMNLYAQSELQLSASFAALLPSIFFGGMTVGRLLLAPLVNRLGILRSLRIFMMIGTVCYLLAFLLGSFGGHVGFALLLPAGLFLSIVYPTLTMAIRLYFSDAIKTTATGFVISCATAFDILFNAFFGSAIAAFGYTVSMRILPVSLVICCLLFLVLPKPQTESL